MSRHLWVISYDIANPQRRYRVEKTLRAEAIRVQKSVFECVLTSYRQERLFQQLSALIDLKTDSLLFYPLCAWCEETVIALGLGGRADLADYYVF